jgi:hypothetical protein
MPASVGADDVKEKGRFDSGLEAREEQQQDRLDAVPNMCAETHTNAS